MSSVAIYMEGGGTGKGAAKLRRGMNKFLGELEAPARAKKMGWKLVLCGSRSETCDAFKNARDSAKGCEIVILLVDAEEPVTSLTVVEHLRNQKENKKDENRKEEKCDLTGVPEEHVHLMVTAMETWIVADITALRKYYGQGFHENSLPLHENLEKVSKEDVAAALDQATKKTKTKGRYHKISHASQLLKMIDPEKVRRRCQHCKRLFDFLSAAIEAG